MNAFGTRVRELRIRRGWKLIDLARQVGKTAGYISRVETQGELPNPLFVCALAEALRANPRELLDTAKDDLLRQTEQSVTERHAGALALFRKSRRM